MLAAEERKDLAAYSRRVLIAAAVVVGLWIAWRLATFLILAFAGILLAVILYRASTALGRVLHMGRRWALALLLVLLAAALIGGGWLFGSQAVSQFQQLGQTVGQGFDQIQTWLRDVGAMQLLGGSGGGGVVGSGLMSRAMTVATTAFDLMAGLLIILFLGIYLAATPGVYRRGIVLLFPKERHAQINAALDEAGEGLWRWMLGQLVSMLTIAVLSTGLLLLLGVPMALALGIIAGLLEFIPILGPWLAAVPAVLVGLTVDVQTAGWVALAYFGIQQVESYVITPLAERWAVSLPPAVTVAAATAFTMLFGFVGLLFATPFVLALIVLVRCLYVRGALQEEPRDGRMPG
ncbi:AI-2E family transporter [Caenispirillum bisanense]|uniref:Predicted PurR-regulated permease PerM n=1 Tax=Caenispirillum bisanense TaxID=414052 RepID=A0A286GCP5_9PROT|nr:AI-2E family transporter [Caenispirillum bisanense]SOD92764.1 Predicted PurR-regulated permease PerM [Caenispirillum bisanense]